MSKGISTIVIESLTDKEREIIIHLANGLTYGEIASRLGKSESTIKGQMRHILVKTGARRGTALTYHLGYYMGQGNG